MNTPILNSLLLFFATSLSIHAAPKDSKTLADFQGDQAAAPWITVNDGVMGGRSKGGFSISKEGSLLFEGKISFENNGGFSSIRTRGQQYDLSAYEGLELRIKGDGRKYYLTTRSSGRDRVAFWSPLQTKKGEWITVKVPFDTFYATFMGRKIPTLNLNTSKVSSIGFMLYDKKDGEFSIEVDRITAYKNAVVFD